MKSFLRRTVEGFVPENVHEFDKLAKIAVGDVVDVEIRLARNYEFHKKFFKLLSVTFKNQDHTTSFQNFREAVTIHAGFYKWIKLLTGEEIKRAESISFNNMDQAEFEKVYNKVFDVCLAILGTTNEELERQVATNFS